MTTVMEDASYVAPAEDFLAQRMDQIDEPYRSFVKDLVSDPDRMVFTFYHNAEYDGVQYEGITFSMGRKRRDDRTKRDRIDIVLEDRRVNGAVDGKIDRVRIYVCARGNVSGKCVSTDRDGTGQPKLGHRAAFLRSSGQVLSRLEGRR